LWETVKSNGGGFGGFLKTPKPFPTFFKISRTRGEPIIILCPRKPLPNKALLTQERSKDASLIVLFDMEYQALRSSVISDMGIWDLESLGI